jgi:hypothetical protein
MSEIVLEQRVTEVEKQIIRLGRKMDGYGKDSHESLTRLEDWLIQYSIENQKGIKESQRWRKSMEEKHQEHDQELKELRKSLADSQQRTEQGFVELRKSLADSQHNLENIQQRNEQGFKELRKKIADSRKELGQISHRLGTIVEDLVAPSLPRVFREIVKCPADEDVLINVRVRRRHPSQKGKMLEIDAMADCGNYVLFNETKSQFSPEKVKAFLEKLALVREYFPEYQSHQIRGCIASLYLDKSLVEYASRQGLLALASGEYLMTVQNDAGFSWKAF